MMMDDDDDSYYSINSVKTVLHSNSVENSWILHITYDVFPTAHDFAAKRKGTWPVMVK